jgi:hypothetical protein
MRLYITNFSARTQTEAILNLVRFHKAHKQRTIQHTEKQDVKANLQPCYFPKAPPCKVDGTSTELSMEAGRREKTF